jgi:hypothetical protein
MRIRLIEENEAPVAVPVGESVLWVRRVPESERRDIVAKRRREMRGKLGGNDPEATAAFLQAVEDDMLDRALARWDRMEGDPPCARENKLRLPEAARVLVRAYTDSAVRLDGEAEEDVRKNSAPPSAMAAS